MESFLLYFLFLWCCISVTTLKIENGTNETGQSIHTLFEKSYRKLGIVELGKTVIQDNDILGMELCLSLASIFGETDHNDYEKKTCTISYLPKFILTEQNNVVFMRLVECICNGNEILSPFYIRENSVNNDISMYFIFKLDDREVCMSRKGKYLRLTGMLNSYKGILYYHYVPLRNEKSNLLNKNKKKSSDGRLLKSDEKSILENENDGKSSDG